MLGERRQKSKGLYCLAHFPRRPPISMYSPYVHMRICMHMYIVHIIDGPFYPAFLGKPSSGEQKQQGHPNRSPDFFRKKSWSPFRSLN